MTRLPLYDGACPTLSTATWRLVTDGVMGGLSQGRLQTVHYQGRDAVLLSGVVTTANNGGFIQMALDLTADQVRYAATCTGLRLTVAGNQEPYNLHLRTADLSRPWQSYRLGFTAGRDWQTLDMPFAELHPYRTEQPFRAEQLLRIGLVAIGRNFNAELYLAAAELYHDNSLPP